MGPALHTGFQGQTLGASYPSQDSYLHSYCLLHAVCTVPVLHNVLLASSITPNSYLVFSVLFFLFRALVRYESTNTCTSNSHVQYHSELGPSNILDDA